ncbi:hypothetical protein ACQR1V_30790 [Bradyrhizobium oligotrophicum]|uniref:hypothetical protein n=1 Tax=Bradyrhizobium oligotrophicum TaxID=44255 RepID=UPI003EBFDEFA
MTARKLLHDDDIADIERQYQYLLRQQHDRDGFDLLEGSRHIGDDVSGPAEAHPRRPEATVLRSPRRSIGSLVRPRGCALG